MNKEVYNFETGMYRPPSEGGSSSLLVRFTRNCPWNRCAFCAMYKTEKFEIRSLSEICADIDQMTSIRDELESISEKSWIKKGKISRSGAGELIRRHPELQYLPGFPMLFEFLVSGGKTAFLQDGNSIIMKTPDLVEALRYLRASFPDISRVTTYARSRTIAKKKQAELLAIREAGLDRLHVGLETGDDELLTAINKGASAEDHVKAGRKAMEADFQLSEYWMPGLGGKHGWENHAKKTASVLNAINPHYIRSRPFRPIPSTPLHEAWSRGEMALQTEKEQLRELRLTINDLDVTSRLCFDHAGNAWRDAAGRLLFTHDYEGYRFPDEKPRLLERIDRALANGRNR